MATASPVPMPLPFFVLWFALSIIHGSWRAAKNWEGLGTHIMWMTSCGCEVDVGGGGGYPTTFVCDKPFLLVKSSTVDLMNVWSPGHRWRAWWWSLVRYLNVDPSLPKSTLCPPDVIHMMGVPSSCIILIAVSIFEKQTHCEGPFACIHNVWLKFSSLHIHIRGREGRGREGANSLLLLCCCMHGTGQ